MFRSRSGFEKKTMANISLNLLATLHLKPALNAGLIEMTISEKPGSRLQKYRLTNKAQKR